MRRTRGTAAAGLLLGVVFAALILRSANGQPAVAEPGGDPASAHMAQANPDEYAWRIFEFINLQAAPDSAGVPAPGKSITQYDDNTSTVWETWALSSGNGNGQSGSEVFKPDGSDPGDWNHLPRSVQPPKVFSVDLKMAAAIALKLGIGHGHTVPAKSSGQGLRNTNLLIGPGNPVGDFEVRMNSAAFGYVQRNTMYNIEGLSAKYEAALATGNRDLIQFPPAAKEVKADWIPTQNPAVISSDEKARYHWRKVGNAYYKLTGFHITTKDLKLWFWADFAQEDFETTPGAALPSRDSTTRGPEAPDRGTKDGERKELIGSKWSHYRLRGTQISYLDAKRAPIVLGNTMIEQGRANQSSCMTCHFNATIAKVLPDGTLDSLSGGTFVTGNPNAAALGTDNAITYLQNDFEWSAPFRAQHKVSKP
jgi:hypothetical protein